MSINPEANSEQPSQEEIEFGREFEKDIRKEADVIKKYAYSLARKEGRDDPTSEDYNRASDYYDRALAQEIYRQIGEDDIEAYFNVLREIEKQSFGLLQEEAGILIIEGEGSTKQEAADKLRALWNHYLLKMRQLVSQHPQIRKIFRGKEEYLVMLLKLYSQAAIKEREDSIKEHIL